MRGEKDTCILDSPDYHDADEHLLKCSHVSVSGRSQISENIPPLKVHYAHCSQSAKVVEGGVQTQNRALAQANGSVKR